MAYLPPSPLFKLGDTVVSLPKALCALVVCRSFQQLETYSEHVLLSEEALFGENVFF